MPKCFTTDLWCGIFEAPRCNGYVTRHPSSPCTNNVTKSSVRDGEDKFRLRTKDDSESDVNGIMGCSQSQQPSAFQNGEELAKHAYDLRAGIEKTDSTESTSGDEDQTAIAVDRIGRQTASNADLINVQRSEKTDVTSVLEDRWLRSHFSGTDAGATALSGHQSAPYIHDESESVSHRKNSHGAISSNRRPSAIFDGVKDLHLTKSQDCVAVSSGSEIHNYDPPQSVRKRFSVLHFNDVYELTERRRKPIGGAARFSTLFQQVGRQAQKDCHGEPPFIAFGGDCLNPSILSSATKGKHMIQVLNQLKINAAVFGNHEFDFGVEHAEACVKNMNFPWFLSNVTDKFNDQPLADGVVCDIIEWNDIKIGVIGLIEEEWLDTLATVDKCELQFEDYVTRGNDLSRDLKERGAHIVIALTHMRWPNDIRLAREVETIDLILGGHDHEYGVKLVNNCVIVKSGCDFQTFSRVDVFIKNGCDIDVSVTRYDVTDATPPDCDMKAIVDRYMTVLEEQLQERIGITQTPLNGLYKDVRSKETNLGNFVSDIMRMTTRAEIVLINSGTFRSNATHSKGDFRVRDLMSILPIHDNVVIIEVTGQQLLDGLENAVSKYPRHEGRFPQISGFSFGFDHKAPPLKRVVRDSVIIKGEPLEETRVYKLATKAYVARGKDGYECFSNCRLLSDPDSGPVLSTVIRNHISNVWHLLRHEEKTGNKIKVTEGGTKIASKCGNLHEVHSYCFMEEDAPVYKLQKSMEEIVPKDVDINGNKRRRESERAGKPIDCKAQKKLDGETRDGWKPHMQHLIEISRDDIFDESEKVNEDIAIHRRNAIEADKKNYQLLSERQRNFEDVRWQVLPLLEARIFHCPKH